MPAPAAAMQGLRTPVVSVGNIAMGGRGKTPVVAGLARRLLALGARPALLSRGYGRRRIEDGVVVVSDGLHVLADLDRSGDEPLMLARQLPGVAVLVCEQRAMAAALATRLLGATALILDDGFQHAGMARDLDLVIIAPQDLAGRRVPFGRLRESPRALARADAVFVDGDLPDADRGRISVPLFTLRRSIGAPHALTPEAPVPAPGAAIVAVAGVAQPARFSQALEAQGWRVARLLAYRDHHRYGPADLAAIVAAVRDTGAAGVLTTEKDAVRLMPWRPWAVPIAAVPLHVTIEPQVAFDAWFGQWWQERGHGA